MIRPTLMLLVRAPLLIFVYAPVLLLLQVIRGIGAAFHTAATFLESHWYTAGKELVFLTSVSALKQARDAVMENQTLRHRIAELELQIEELHRENDDLQDEMDLAER